MKDKRYYIGETSDNEKRLAFHNSGLQRSTKHRIPFILVKYETYDDRSQALRREKEIKKWKGGLAFRRLIEGM